MKIKTNILLIPLSLCIIGLVIRIALISKGPYMGDTLYLVIQASKILSDHTLHYLQHPGYPLTALLGALSILAGKLFSLNDPAMAVNTANVLLSTGCLYLNYRISEKLLGQRTAFFSSALLLANPIFLSLSVVGNSHIPCIFFLLWSLYIFLIFFETGRPRTVVSGAFLLGLAAACRIQDVLVTAPAFIYFMCRYQDILSGHTIGTRNHAVRLRPLLTVAMISAVTVAVFYIPYAYLHFGSDQTPALPNDTNFFFTDRFTGLFSYPMLFLLRDFRTNYTFLGILLIFSGLILLWKNKRHTAVFLLLWILIPLLIIGSMNILVPRYLAIIILPLNIILGYFFSSFCGKNIFSKAALLSGFLFIIIMNAVTIFPPLKIRHDRALMPEFCRWLARQTEPHARIIAGDETLFIGYYSNRSIFSRPYFPENFDEDAMTLFLQKLKDTLSEDIPVYSTGTGLFSYDSDGNFYKHLSREFDVSLIGKHLSEDWHSGLLHQKIGLEGLYRISRK